MTNTIILHGPKASGKTHHAKQIAAHYGCTSIIDNWKRLEDEMYPGALHITDEDLSGRPAISMMDMESERHSSVQVVSIGEAIESMVTSLASDSTIVAHFINALAERVHQDNRTAGWWSNPRTGEDILETRNVPEMLMLIVSEVAEAMEGHRKNLMDDKLLHRPMLTTELADAVIRILDLAGSRARLSRQCGEPEHRLGDIMQEKREFNRHRPDHKIENRLKEGGKAF